MATFIAKNSQSLIIGSVVLVTLFAIAWQSRLFGLNTQKETVTVRTGSDDADYVLASEDSLSGGEAGQDGTRSRQSISKPRKFEIITLLPFDAIPAIFDPTFVSVEEADKSYEPDEKVLGISLNGDHRAYSVPMLSRHEIVNDTVGGVKIAVTW